MKFVVELYSKTGELKGVVATDSGNAATRGRINVVRNEDILLPIINTKAGNRFVIGWTKWANVEYEVGDVWIVYAKLLDLNQPPSELRNQFPPEYPPLRMPN